jgi:hypothetical protein
MVALMKRLSVAAVVAAVGLLLANSAQAQQGPGDKKDGPRINPANMPANQGFAPRMIGADPLAPGVALPPVGAPGGNPFLSGGNPYAGYSAGSGATLSSTGYGGVGGYDSPYSPYNNPYTANYAETPFRDYFSGIADLTNAYGKYKIDFQRARILHQQVEMAKLDYRRRQFDEWRYRIENMPDPEALRQRDRAREVARARRSPPITEVLTAKSLNDLLEHAKEGHSKGLVGPPLPLDDETLKRINVRTAHGGNIGLLKNGKLSWPLPLRSADFEENRKKLETALEDGINRAKINGSVDATLLKDMLTALRGLHTTLDKVDTVSKITTAQYIEGKRYLNFLDDAMRALQDPNVANYFGGKFQARGKTVGDLVQYMAAEGLEFAAAVPGDEAAYRAVHNALAAYDENLTDKK